MACFLAHGRAFRLWENRADELALVEVGKPIDQDAKALCVMGDLDSVRTLADVFGIDRRQIDVGDGDLAPMPWGYAYSSVP